MILIDKDTDAKLVARLENIRSQAENVRCIYFDLKGTPQIEASISEKIIVAACEHIPSEGTQIYLCGDGDIFILAPTIPRKCGREFILNIATELDRPATKEWVCFVELPLHVNALLMEAEAKLDKRHKEEEEKRKTLVQQQAERKRQAILNGGVSAKREDMKNRRAARKTLEMMIIEDDAFSRRLVENVLQRKYPLTGLGEATHALDTYARVAPDLLFLDINLPDVTGHELLEKIIALDPDAYVVMLSSNCDRENVTQAMSKGAKGFVAKPFTKDKLFQYIERCPTIQRA